VSFDFEGHETEDIALLFPGWDKGGDVLVRVHSECLTGDVFGSHRCDCNGQLNEAIDRMAVEGGILIYLRQEGRGIGLYNKLDAYKLQIEEGQDTFEANLHLGLPEDARDYKIASDMLKELGVSSIWLLTNNPDKVRALEEAGIAVYAIMPTGVHVTDDNVSYLSVKKQHGHTIGSIVKKARG
jgi:GTP cyclohydrolase II